MTWRELMRGLQNMDDHKLDGEVMLFTDEKTRWLRSGQSGDHYTCLDATHSVLKHLNEKDVRGKVAI